MTAFPAAGFAAILHPGSILAGPACSPPLLRGDPCRATPGAAPVVPPAISSPPPIVPRKRGEQIRALRANRPGVPPEGDSVRGKPRSPPPRAPPPSSRGNSAPETANNGGFAAWTAARGGSQAIDKIRLAAP